MNYIVDTHALLWMMLEPHKLSHKVQGVLADKRLHKYVSTASLWEMAIKNRIGKLPLPMGISEIFSRIVTLGVGQISLDQWHIETYASLPLLHRDPFDGIIIATAIVENMTIITTDENIQKYDVPWIW